MRPKTLLQPCSPSAPPWLVISMAPLGSLVPPLPPQNIHGSGLSGFSVDFRACGYTWVLQSCGLIGHLHPSGGSTVHTPQNGQQSLTLLPQASQAPAPPWSLDPLAPSQLTVPVESPCPSLLPALRGSPATLTLPWSHFLPALPCSSPPRSPYGVHSIGIIKEIHCTHPSASLWSLHLPAHPWTPPVHWTCIFG